MSDFIRKIIEEMGEAGQTELGAHLAEAFDIGLKAAQECRTAIINKHSTPFFVKGQALEATMVIFVCLWSLVRWAEEGVNKSAKDAEARGERSPVKSMWDLLEVSMRAKSEAEALAAMEKIRREILGE